MMKQNDKISGKVQMQALLCTKSEYLLKEASNKAMRKKRVENLLGQLVSDMEMGRLTPSSHANI